MNESWRDDAKESVREKIAPSGRVAPDSLLKKLGVKQDTTKVGISEGRVKAVMTKLRALISYFREYSDLWLDTVRDPMENFNFFFYQRVFLRAVTRHRYTYATFPRAYSKSFLSILALYVRCVMYPNSKLFIVSGGKEQSAKIAQEKLDEIWKFFPALKGELVWEKGPGGTKMQRDYINLRFKNGSYLDIVAAQQSSRGGRRTAGLIEEAAQVPGQILSEVVIPMMNVSRRAAFGGEDMNDITNKSQIYIEFDLSKKIVYNIFTEYGKSKAKSNKDFKHSVIKIFIGSQLCHYLAISRRKPFELLGTP